MKRLILTIIVSLIAVGSIVMGFVSGVSLNELQLKTLLILGIICAVSMLYCFIVGEITMNNSQMDKLWSILPIIYAWVIAIMGNMNMRLVVMALLISIWGCRLTGNFAKKGAYSIKFWTGEEDYRWAILRKNKMFNKRWKWALFDLLFISIYQNLIVLAICLPMLACMSSSVLPGVMDYVATCLTFIMIIYETIADEEQMNFQTKKWAMIKEGKKLEELPEPYNLGFNTTGLWKFSRHPNYFAEQSIWIFLYLFTIGAGVVSYGIFNWTIIGSMLLLFIFMGSSRLAEDITKSKYPKYEAYQKQVLKYLPIRMYKKNK